MRRGKKPLRFTDMQARGRVRAGGRRAFSLVELVLTLSIIAIAGAVALPRYGRALARYRAETGARRIIADLERARQTAKATSAGCKVQFDQTGYIVEPVVVTGPDDKYRVDLSREPYLAKILSINFSGDSVIYFDGYGVPDSGGSLVVNSGVGAFQVDLDPQAGKARYQRYTGALIVEGGG